jgi:transcriptional regulator with XRE-family HTH domain
MRAREILAVNLKRLRAERGLSQEEMAHLADIDRTYVSALERGVYAASLDVLEQIARALNVEPADLLATSPKGSVPATPTRRRMRTRPRGS